MKIFILGANGFIGSHLSEAILTKTDWQVFAMDLSQNKLVNCLGHERFHFYLGDMLVQKEWVTDTLKQSDIVLPLAAIATPANYMKNPLGVFELGFEANLDIIRQCVHYEKRIVFPSTSEVYGMCPDAEFDEEKSTLVTGPVHKERWIYSTSKQLLDRLIYAYGKHYHLSYTLFRPFNWYGPKLDDIFNAKQGGSRVLTQFIGNILRGEDILLINGGLQQRCFAYIDDGVDALLKIIDNKNNCAFQRIFNIGNPAESISIRALAELLIQFTHPYSTVASKTKLIDVDAEQYYGAGYQDIVSRVPNIRRAEKYLGWKPQVNLAEGLRKTLEFYFN